MPLRQGSLLIPADTKEQRGWDNHWQALDERRFVFGMMSRMVRRLIFQPAVRHYTEAYFPDDGVFVEMGCGTSESSALIPERRRRLYGLDFSLVALQKAKRFGHLHHLASGDLLHIPFRDESVSGIWNLGVMEHFQREKLLQVLREFHRVLKPGGIALMFWPTEFNSSRWILGPIEQLRSAVSGSAFHFFPDEVYRLRSKRDATQLLEHTGFEALKTDFSLRTACIHMVVVGRKATA